MSETVSPVDVQDDDAIFPSFITEEPNESGPAILVEYEHVAANQARATD